MRSLRSLPGAQGGDAPLVGPLQHRASCPCRDFAAANGAASAAAVGILPAPEELAAGAVHSGSSRGRCGRRVLRAGARRKALKQRRPARWQASAEGQAGSGQ